MTRLRAAIVLSLAAGATSMAATAGWQRQMQFARGLRGRQYYALADVVIQRLEANPRHIGRTKAQIYKAIGEYYTDLAPLRFRKGGLDAFVATLDKARRYFRKHIADKRVKEADRFATRLRLCAIAMAMAEAHQLIIQDPKTPKADKEKHKTQAIATFDAAISDLQAMAKQKRDQVNKKKRDPRRPKNDLGKLERWKHRELGPLRVQAYQVQLQYLIARDRKARFLKAIAARNDKGWLALLQQTERLYANARTTSGLLYEFSNEPYAVSAKYYFGRNLMDQGGHKQYERALDRFAAVLRQASELASIRRIPCEAGYYSAVVLTHMAKSAKNKKESDDRYRKAVDMLDRTLTFGSQEVWRGWKKEEKEGKGEHWLRDAVAGTLNELLAVGANQFTRKAGADAFLLMADAYAARGAKAKSGSKNQKYLYRTAYEIASGVAVIIKGLDTKYGDRIESWRLIAGERRTPAILFQRYRSALAKKNYLLAAQLLAELISQRTPKRADLDKAWLAYIEDVIGALDRKTGRGETIDTKAYAKALMEHPKALYDRKLHYDKDKDTLKIGEADADFARATRTHAEFVRKREKFLGRQRRDLRKNWSTVAQCYYFAKRYREAAMVYSALARWFPEDNAHDAALRAVVAMRKQHEISKDPFDAEYLDRLRVIAEGLDPEGRHGYTIRRIRLLRQKGQFKAALDLLETIAPGDKAYASALYERALVHKNWADWLTTELAKKGLTRAKRRELTQQREAMLKKMLTAFDKLLAHYKTARSKLEGPKHVVARKRLFAVTASGLAMLVDAYMRKPLTDYTKVLELTNDFAKRYPGIADTPGAPSLYYKRMLAAYYLLRQTKDDAEAQRLLGIVEAAWRRLATDYPDYRHLPLAVKVGAYCNTEIANRLDAQAAKAPPAEKQKLEKEALARRARRIDLTVELMRIDPRQDLATCRLVLRELRKRATPKADATAAEIGPPAVRAHWPKNGPVTDPRQLQDEDVKKKADAIITIRTAVGLAFLGLAERAQAQWKPASRAADQDTEKAGRDAAALYRAAIGHLQAVCSNLDTRYQSNRERSEGIRERWRTNPAAFPRGFKPPPFRRHPDHTHVMAKLASAYRRRIELVEAEELGFSAAEIAAAASRVPEALSYHRKLHEIYKRKPEKGKEYWTNLEGLCEMLRRLAEADPAKRFDHFSSAVSLIGRNLSRTPDMGGSDSKMAFYRLVARIRDSLKRVDPFEGKAGLIDACNALLKKLEP